MIHDDNFAISTSYANPDSAGVLYAVTVRYSTGVWKTTDGGITWVSKLNTASNALDVRINPNNTNQVIVGCASDVYLSLDYGET